jgi:hypothetical protein
MQVHFYLVCSIRKKGLKQVKIAYLGTMSEFTNCSTSATANATKATNFPQKYENVIKADWLFEKEKGNSEKVL